MTECVVCSRPAAHLHHIVYRQEVRWRHGNVNDPRNLIPVCLRCHEQHHGRVWPLSLSVLPDSMFEFAVELMGEGAAYEYLRRRYAGDDARLDALIERKAA